MAAALPLVVIMEKGAEAAEALNVTEIFYNRVADHIRNQPDAARSHAFDKQRMDELIQALDGWEDLDAQERSRRNKEIGNNRAYKMCKKFCVLDIAGERALVDLVHPPGNGPPVPPPISDAVKVCCVEDWFTCIKEVHEACGHIKSRTLEKKMLSRERYTELRNLQRGTPPPFVASP